MKDFKPVECGHNNFAIVKLQGLMLVCKNFALNKGQSLNILLYGTVLYCI